MESENGSQNFNPQTDIHGDIKTGGGLVNTGNIGTAGGDFVGRDKVIIQQRLDPADLRNQRNHMALRQAVRRFWIDGVLKHSLYNEVLIRLGLDARPQAVNNRPWKLMLQQHGQPDRAIADDMQIGDIFDQMDKRLLILGEPGSGKTTTLLTLADVLLTRTAADPTLPTPVIFNLASWAEKQPKLEEWLIEELNTRYQMPKQVAQDWVANDELLLLLDGLDEVVESKRSACVTTINAFLYAHVVDMAICSRTAEYEALTERLKLVGAVAVRSLTSEQIAVYVEQVGGPGIALNKALAASSELRDLAQSPLLLSVMTLAYHNQGARDDLIQGGGRSELQILFDRYIRRMFEHRESTHFYASQQTVRWLRWLAGQMVKRSQTQFLIERLQPDWLERTRDIYLYRLLVGLIGGLIGGLIVVLIGGLIGELIDRLIDRLLGGLLVGLLVGLISGLSGGSSKIEAQEFLNFSWKNGLLVGLIAGLSFGLLGGLIFGLLVGLLAGLSFGLLGGLIVGLHDLKSMKELRDSWKESLLVGLLGGLIVGLLGGLFGGLSGGLPVGLPFGLLGGLIFGLISGLSGEERSAEAEVKVRPNQGIWQSLKNALSVGLLVGLSVGLLGGLSYGLLDGLFAGLFAGLLFGLTVGLFSCIQHLVLRGLLSRERCMPWNYARFLDYAAARLFLRKVGGSYVFVHRLVLEHFAELTDKDIERITADLS